MALTDDQIARWLDLTGVYMNSPHAFYIMPSGARALYAALVELRDLRNALKVMADCADVEAEYDGDGVWLNGNCLIPPDDERYKYVKLALECRKDASADG